MTRDQMDTLMTTLDDAVFSRTEENDTNGNPLTIVDGVFAIAHALTRIADALEGKKPES